MKLSTRKILGLNGIVLALMMVLALLKVSGVWREYLQIAVLIGAIGVQIMMLGWAKPRGRNTKIATLVMILSVIVFQVVMFVFLGLKLGFVVNIYHWSVEGVFMVFLPMALLIVAEEILRGQMIEKGKGSKLALAAIVVTMVAVEVCFLAPMYEFSGAQAWYELIVVVLCPTILKNIFLTYVALEFSFWINIGYRLVMELPVYFAPVWPNVSPYLTVVFELMFLVVLFGVIVSMRRGDGTAKAETVKIGEEKRETTGELRRRVILGRVGWGIAGVTIVAIVALMSGLFEWYFLSIGSDSMQPVLGRGDMVLVKKTKECKELKLGEILVYSHDEATMVHRIVEVENEGGTCWFKTKGDANASDDNWRVEQSEVVGIVQGKIVAFGYPTLWLNELFNGGK